ncbi:MAG: polymerase subunit gamma/tau, partial [Pseudonocardiales bacterium]|nr:polymerase subunit gamma/tau [Pseudonocardiales bacterium]
AHLETVCAAEGATVEPAVLPLVVRAGGGSARDSLSILDQLLAGAGPGGVTYGSAVALLGVTDGALIDEMVDALAAGDAASVYGTVDRVVEAGHDPRRFSVDLLDRFRDLILLDAVPDAGERGLIDVPQDQLAHMGEQALRLGGGTLTRYAEIVHTALIEMRGTTAPRLVLELLCARMMLPDATDDAAAVLQRLERLERRLTAGAEAADEPQRAQQTPAAKSTAPAKPRAAAPAASTAPAAKPAAQTPPPAKPAPAAAGGEPAAAAPEPASESASEPAASAAGEPEAAAPAGPGTLDAAALRRIWPEVLEVVKQASRRTRALLDNAQVSGVAGEQVTLSAPGALAKMIADESNTSVLRSALTEVVGGTWQIAVEGGAPNGGANGSADAPPTARRTAEPEPDPRDEPEYEPGPVPASTPPVDAESEAMKLLQDQLDARPLEP